LFGSQWDLGPLIERRTSPRDVERSAVFADREVAARDAGEFVLTTFEPPGDRQAADHGGDQQPNG
jgi:hypothetical protein